MAHFRVLRGAHRLQSVTAGEPRAQGLLLLGYHRGPWTVILALGGGGFEGGLLGGGETAWERGVGGLGRRESKILIYLINVNKY